MFQSQTKHNDGGHRGGRYAHGDLNKEWSKRINETCSSPDLAIFQEYNKEKKTRWKITTFVCQEKLVKNFLLRSVRRKLWKIRYSSSFPETCGIWKAGQSSECGQEKPKSNYVGLCCHCTPEREEPGDEAVLSSAWDKLQDRHLFVYGAPTL